MHHEWDNVRKKINLKFLWWHDLRRTWATMAARERVDMIQISRQLGHANMRITEEHYAHYHPDYMGQASDHSSHERQCLKQGAICFRGFLLSNFAMTFMG